ncbi:FAD-binding oxidoreductase [Mesorhizobium loti]|nr:FAD-binding oxidoreductase [Mesorhizobium loti]
MQIEPTDLATTLWAATAPPPPPTLSLNGDDTADVVVVGAGYTGLSTALHVAESGRNVVVLEAKDIGYGGSGRNAGHCTPTFQHMSLATINRLHGVPWGRRMVAMQLGAGREVADIVERYGIDCDLRWNGFLQVAHVPSVLATIAKRNADYAALGAACRTVDKAEAAALTGSPRFFGGWLLKDAGHLNPLGYARGLAAAATGLGARIFTQSPVLAIRPQGNRWRVETSDGAVTANRVLIATGAYTGKLWPGLSAAFAKSTVACMATAPLPDAVRSTVLPGGNHVLDTRGDFTNMRLDVQGRLVTSVFVERVRGRNRTHTSRMMSDRFEWVFPQLRGIEWEHYWFGDVDMHPHTFPQYFQLAEGVTAALGYSSRGVPTATAMGKAIAQHLIGTPVEALQIRLKPFKRAPIGFGRIPGLLLPIYRWKDARQLRQGGVDSPRF